MPGIGKLADTGHRCCSVEKLGIAIEHIEQQNSLVVVGISGGAIADLGHGPMHIQ